MSFLKSIFSPDAPKINFNPASFSGGGGAGGTFNFGIGGGASFTESAALAGNLGGLQQTFARQAAEIGGLRPMVAPGFSAFRQAGLSDLDTQQQANISNLRDNLATRRVMGSSFAGDAISRANAEFAQKRDQFIAQTYLQEVEASNKLIQEQYEASSNQFKVGINQFNFESQLTAQLTSQAMATSAAVATAQAKLDADAAAGLGKFIGSTLGTAIGIGSKAMMA